MALRLHKAAHYAEDTQQLTWTQHKHILNGQLPYNFSLWYQNSKTRNEIIASHITTTHRLKWSVKNTKIEQEVHVHLSQNSRRRLSVSKHFIRARQQSIFTQFFFCGDSESKKIPCDNDKRLLFSTIPSILMRNIKSSYLRKNKDWKYIYSDSLSNFYICSRISALDCRHNDPRFEACHG